MQLYKWYRNVLIRSLETIVYIAITNTDGGKHPSFKLKQLTKEGLQSEVCKAIKYCYYLTLNVLMVSKRLGYNRLILLQNQTRENEC